ncbi:hypothetical protein CDL15_Pgr000265 [Punica granatum]|nr:hypothetical protein CDL15_Pgr000265 [Punica granatum]
MGRAPCCDKDGLKKGPWTPEEDQKLINYIQKHGNGNWRILPKNAGLQRCGKSCRLRWTNYLRPDIKRGRFSFDEEEAIIQLHSILGNKWSAIASRLPGRTDNEIKNYWNTHIRKQLLRMGIDPVTHSPRLDLLDLSSILNSTLYNSSHHMVNDISTFLQVDPSTNPEILKLATSLGLSQSENQKCPFQQSQISNCQLQESYHPTDYVQENLLAHSAVPSTNEPNLREPISRQYQPDFSGLFPISSDNYIYSSEQPGFNPPSENLQDFNLSSNNNNDYQNFSYGASVYSTPSSSPTPLNSNSAYINSGTEDEREISYCSKYDLMRYEIPEILDVNELL